MVKMTRGRHERALADALDAHARKTQSVQSHSTNLKFPLVCKRTGVTKSIDTFAEIIKAPRRAAPSDMSIMNPSNGNVACGYESL